MSNLKTPSDPITIGVGEACRLSGLGMTTIYKLIGDGRLRVVRIRGRTLVRYDSLKALLVEDDGRSVSMRVGAGKTENANQ